MAASGTALTSLVLFMAGFQTTYCADYYIAETNFTSGEHRLFFDLFTTYNKHVRPVDSSHSSTNVFFELSLFNLLRLDTKRQEMVINSEMIMKWKDRFLEWDPDDYNGTTSIRVPYTDIWYPDIILYNTADTNYMGSIINTNAIILYTGEVELVSHALITSVCNVDVQWYPFDQQLCHLTFASWTYDYEKIRLIMGEPDLSDYEENPEFFLENFWAEPKDYHQPCCPKPFSAIKYHLQLQRRTIFSLFFFIMPGILINICAVMVFSLPAEAGEKVGLGINSMLAMMVFLMAMTENLPPTKKLPLAESQNHRIPESQNHRITESLNHMFACNST
ncbi:neuronal acetylcholine receptor subunit alpha-10-like [Penaeus japonicus]|uniref:neuronal acetylcholine receptor subunit alpha-10-like n=1 Tax=Penaeus japonicus TaxID=27405 RepID=UPI001C71427C|nr:neuronal acetylcholine receptor subunit alpha-10-like [Penaeus japonicus]